MAAETRRNAQDAPYPTILADLVSRLKLDPGWRVWLEDDATRDTGSPEQGHGLTLTIRTMSFDTYHPERGRHYGVLHSFAVPPATYNEQSWQRWLFDRYVDVLRHEGMEFFALRTDDFDAETPCADCEHPATRHDGRVSSCADCPPGEEHRFTIPIEHAVYHRPYAPNHGPGNDPYQVRELTTDMDRRTQYTGNVDHR